jgi:multicomponent Na+:H+ antiporter subunit B
VNSLILTTATRFMVGLFFLMSIFLLVRGHDDPGGGFIGGLTAAGAIALHTIAFGVAESRKFLRVAPQAVIGAGLAVALGSGIVSLLAGEPFLTDQHAGFSLADGAVHITSALAFDAGVYLVVVGIVSLIVFSVAEE